MIAPRSLGPAILRVAGWPIEALDPLRAPGFAARVDAWIDADEALARANAALALRLHADIPGIADRTARGAALALKRHLHAGTRPPPDDLLAALPRALADEVAPMRPRWLAHAAERAAIEDAHAAELDRAGAALDRATAEPRFRRALCLASPTLYARCREADAGRLGRRSRRRLHLALHRYLMRAIGRATPNGLWAGIALEDPGEPGPGPVALRPAPERVRVCPDLALFAPALDAASLRCLDAIRLRLNPTLRQGSDGTWRFGTFAAGAWQQRQADDHPALRALCDAFSPADRPTARAVARALAPNLPGADAAVARQVVAYWLAHGLLWSSLALPPHHADTWEALDAIVASLPASERPAWETCRRALREVAAAIEADIEAMDPDALRRALDAARASVAALVARDGLALPAGRDVLLLDRTAPFRFSLTPDLAAAIAERLRACWAFDRLDLGAAETRALMRETFGRGPIPLADLLHGPEPGHPADSLATWEARLLPRLAGPDAAAAAAAFARWEAEIAPRARARAHRLAEEPGTAAPMPPGAGLLMIGLTADGPVLRLGGMVAEPCFFYARFAALLRPDRGEPDAFRAWLDAGLDAARRLCPQVEACDLAVRNAHNPNVSARPRLAERMLDPLDDGGRLLRDARVALDAEDRPVLWMAGADPPRFLLPSARGAAHLGGIDPCAALLSAVTLGLGRPPLLAPMPRLSREVRDWHHLPRLLLGDAAIGPERWTPPDTLGRALAAANGSERFVAWRRYVRRAGLPDLVHVFHGRRQTETLMATDSALGLAHLALSLQAGEACLRLQEVFPHPACALVRDASGRRYLSELAVAWHADPGFWEAYAAAAREAAREPERPCVPA